MNSHEWRKFNRARAKRLAEAFELFGPPEVPVRPYEIQTGMAQFDSGDIVRWNGLIYMVHPRYSCGLWEYWIDNLRTVPAGELTLIQSIKEAPAKVFEYYRQPVGTEHAWLQNTFGERDE